MKLRRLLAGALIVLLVCGGTWAAEQAPPKPSHADKCPVCGMFIYKYPDWTGVILFKDSTRAFFDGAKDLFKYYLTLGKYNPHKTLADIDRIYVTEYYRMEPIDARSAFFVAGSDVYGPMGHELIPLATESDARQFMQDHRGRRILRFSQITPAVIQTLD